MLSSDKNVETLAQLIDVLKHYLGTQAEYVRLDIIDKVVRLLTAAALSVVLFLIAVAIMLFLSLALASWLASIAGLTAALLIVAALHGVLLLTIVAFRKPWIERPLVRYLAHLLLG